MVWSHRADMSISHGWVSWGEEGSRVGEEGDMMVAIALLQRLTRGKRLREREREKEIRNCVHVPWAMVGG